MIQLSKIWFPTLLLAFIWALLSRPAQKDLSLLAHTPSGEPANILLLTAHPDDECMFFAPTILGLLDDHAVRPRPVLHSLCLSIGNADGFGDVRRRELARSLDVLGIQDMRRWVVDIPDLQDNFTAEWDPQTIADVLRPYVVEHDISTILTFDHQGVSSHPNHISLPKGAAYFLHAFPNTAEKPRPRLFSLVTVPLHQKYLGFIAPLYSKLVVSFQRRGRGPTAVSDWARYTRALEAMRQHRSQLVWFRWLYVSFSRYMWVNEWVTVELPSEVQSADAAKA